MNQALEAALWEGNEGSRKKGKRTSTQARTYTQTHTQCSTPAIAHYPPVHRRAELRPAAASVAAAQTAPPRGEKRRERGVGEPSGAGEGPNGKERRNKHRTQEKKIGEEPLAHCPCAGSTIPPRGFPGSCSWYSDPAIGRRVNKKKGSRKKTERKSRNTHTHRERDLISMRWEVRAPSDRSARVLFK